MTKLIIVHQQTDRIVKYGVLVIALTFAAIFVNGLLSNRRAHPVQYLLVGAAICLFYLLVLSLAEQFAFGASYVIASLADIGTVALFAALLLAMIATRNVDWHRVGRAPMPQQA